MKTYDGGWKCCFCKKPIADQDVPLEAKKKIGLQLVWHEACNQ